MEKGDHERNFAFPQTKSQWLLEVERQDNELIKWIDEFLESEEYAEILRERVDLQPKSESFYWKNERMSVENDEKDRIRPDYLKHGDLVLLEEKIKESLTRLMIQNTVENQRRGIEIIRVSMLLLW